MSERPWRNLSDEDDSDWDEPLPEVVVLTPDYGAELPLWGELGNINWHFTRFSCELLDRLAAWQEEFDDNFHPWESGWRSASVRDRWAREADDLASAVRSELGTRSKLVVDLWPLE